MATANGHAPLLVDSRGRALSDLTVPDTFMRALQRRDTLALAGLIGRRKLARRAGKQYGGRRDVYTAAGYIEEGELGFEHYHSAYKRGDIAGRVVDMPAQTTWRETPVLSIPGEESHPFVDQFEAMAKRLRLWNRFERVDRLAGIGRYAVLFVGVRGDGDDGSLREEMPTLQSPDDVLFLTAIHEGDAKVNTWETDPRDNPRFMLPRTYDIKFSGDLPGFTGKTVEVHWSRVIHVAEDVLDNDVFGRPRLERIFNRLADLDKILASTGEAYWQLAQRILVGSIDEKAEATPDLIEDLGEDMEEMVHDLRRQIVAQGFDLKWLESTPPDPASAVKVYLFMIAAAAGIPMRILFGTETGERASEQDERQWFGTVSERQERYAEPDILRAFVDRLATKGAFGNTLPEEYEVEWPNLYQPTPQEEQDANAATAKAAKDLTPMGGDPRELVRVEEGGRLTFRTSEELEELGVFVPGEAEQILPDLPPGPPEEEGSDVDDEGLDDVENRRTFPRTRRRTAA